jgi:hypothetical protein
MSEDQNDITGLMRKNAELLAEVKALKGRLQEADSAREAALQAASDAQATMRRVALETPLEGALASRFVVPWRIIRPMLDDYFAFDTLADLPGQIATIPDLAALLHPPRGGGAPGSAGNRDFDAKPKAPEKIASPFGLR